MSMGDLHPALPDVAGEDEALRVVNNDNESTTSSDESSTSLPRLFFDDGDSSSNDSPLPNRGSLPWEWLVLGDDPPDAPDNANVDPPEPAASPRVVLCSSDGSRLILDESSDEDPSRGGIDFGAAANMRRSDPKEAHGSSGQGKKPPPPPGSPIDSDMDIHGDVYTTGGYSDCSRGDELIGTAIGVARRPSNPFINDDEVSECSREYRRQRIANAKGGEKSDDSDRSLSSLKPAAKKSKTKGSRSESNLPPRKHLRRSAGQLASKVGSVAKKLKKTLSVSRHSASIADDDSSSCYRMVHYHGDLDSDDESIPSESSGGSASDGGGNKEGGDKEDGNDGGGRRRRRRREEASDASSSNDDGSGGNGKARKATPKKGKLTKSSPEKPPKLKKSSPEKPPKTTSRKFNTGAQIAVGKRVYSTRGLLYHIALTKQKEQMSVDWPNNKKMYGKVVGRRPRGRNAVWDVAFDDFPEGNKIITGLSRKKLHVLHPNEEEAPNDWLEIDDALELLDNVEGRSWKRKKSKEARKSARAFCRQSGEKLRKAEKFVMPVDKENKVVWGIVPEGEHLEDEDFEMPFEPPPLNLDWSKDLCTMFFDDFFPSIKGHAELWDKYLADPRATHSQTVRNEKIKFHDPLDDDPDWKVRQFYLLLIAGVGEHENGTKALWQRGESEGGHIYPDFGRYMSGNEFKAAMSAAPYAFCDKAYWYLDKRDMPWEVFEPALNSMNSKRAAIFGEFLRLLLVDETMVDWRPSHTKRGGMPTFVYEPRKPYKWGGMLRNALELTTAIMRYQLPVKDSELMDRLKYSGWVSHMPNKSLIPPHVAETLRLSEGAALGEGDWVCGDAHFGSTENVVEHYCILGAKSTFVVKGNTSWFPKEALLAVLKARHGNRPMGHWVVFSATISGVPIIAMAYAFTNNSLPVFIVSSYTDTRPCSKLYKAKYEDGYGVPSHHYVPRPNCAHFILDECSEIDEHNKKHCRKELNVFGTWQTKDAFFRLISLLVAQSAVDLLHAWRCHDHRMYGDMTVVDFSTRKLVGRNLRRRDRLRGQSAAEREFGGTLRRIADDDGETEHPLTLRERLSGKTVGKAKNGSCFICRKYKAKTVSTNFCCMHCGTPLCNKDRSNDRGRMMSCYDEHMKSPHSELRCNGRRKHTFPKTLREWWY